MLTYAEVLSRVEEARNKHLLLGNGFSRAYDDNIFSYDALLNRANFSGTDGPILRSFFQVLRTSDFERIIRFLVDLDAVIPALPIRSGTQRRIEAFIHNLVVRLREILAETLSRNHPDGVFILTDHEKESAAQFLAPYDKKYTLNYDLLIYWSLMHALGSNVNVDDGFRAPISSATEYVSWEPENRLNQNVYYVHGALHLYDAGSEFCKYTWLNTGIRLIDQVRSALNEGKYPLIVTEGTWQAKKEKILHNMYLAHSYKSLLTISDTLVIYGWAMNEHDTHVLHALRENTRLKNIYVGIFGPRSSEGNQFTISQAESLAMRGDRRVKSIFFYDASSVNVWGR